MHLEEERLVKELTEEHDATRSNKVVGLHVARGKLNRAVSAVEEGKTFNIKAEYVEYLQGINALVVEDFREYKNFESYLRLKDPENPALFRDHILMECADGRNSLTLFLPEEKLLGRFAINWLPFAGNIIFPEIKDLRTVADLRVLFGEDSELKKKTFERIAYIYGAKIKKSIKEFKEGRLGKVFIEFQAHFDAHNEAHGCGAHKSNLLAAQLETIKDCMIMECWLKEVYPTEFEKGVFKVFRTTHNTGKGGVVYQANVIDEKLPREGRVGYDDLFMYAATRFASPVAHNKAEGIVRDYKGNPLHIDLEHHDEQVVRISDTHLASTLEGQSVMEVAWTDDEHILFAHIKVLLSIIEKNFRANNPEKPAIVHFDLVEGDENRKVVLKKVLDLWNEDVEIRAALAADNLDFIVTATNEEDMQMKMAA